MPPWLYDDMFSHISYDDLAFRDDYELLSEGVFKWGMFSAIKIDRLLKVLQAKSIVFDCILSLHTRSPFASCRVLIPASKKT